MNFIGPCPTNSSSSRGLPDSSSEEPRCRSWTCENPAVWSPDRFFLWRGVGGKDLGYWGLMGVDRDSWGLMGMNEFLVLQLERSNYDDFGAGWWCFWFDRRGVILWNHGRIFHAQEEHDLEIEVQDMVAEPCSTSASKVGWGRACNHMPTKLGGGFEYYFCNPLRLGMSYIVLRGHDWRTASSWLALNN